MSKFFAKYKKVIVDLIYSTVSYAAPVFCLQFIVQPLIAQILGAEKNGLFLTIIALNYFIVNITATVLHTVRLLSNSKYEEENLKGDFNILWLAFTALNVIIMTVGVISYTNSSNIAEIVLSAAIVVLFMYHDYITVQYRVKLSYNKIFIDNMILCVGYFLGLGFLKLTGYWQFVFIAPYAASAVFNYFNTDFIREPFKITKLFKATSLKYLALAGSVALGTCVNYCDRLILYPLLGGEQVSIFTAASIMGKMLALVSTPLSNVILSYVVKIKDFKIKFKKIYIVIAVAGLIGAYFLMNAVSIPLLNFLYPEYSNESLAYVPLTTVLGLITLLTLISNTLVLRFSKPRWQIIANGTYLSIYFVVSLTLLHFYGLYGFCVGNIIAAIFKFAIIGNAAIRGVKKEIAKTDKTEETVEK